MYAPRPTCMRTYLLPRAEIDGVFELYQPRPRAAASTTIDHRSSMANNFLAISRLSSRLMYSLYIQGSPSAKTTPRP